MNLPDSSPAETVSSPGSPGPTRIHVVTGFLGSGKTTLLRQLLEQGIPGERVAVLVNEFGEVGIDGGLLRRSGQPVVELDSGCICCEVGADMLATVASMLREYHPDRIVFELSGLAEPGSVLAALTGRSVAVGSLRVEPTICVVDAGAYQQLSAELEYGYWNQIQAADIVLVNKVDQLPPEDLHAVQEHLATTNPHAMQVPCEHCKVEVAQLFDAMPTSARPSSGLHPKEHLHGFHSFVIRDRGTVFERSRIERMLGGLEPGVFRVKGTVLCREGSLFVNWVRSGPSWEAAAPSDPEPTTLVCIGRSMNPEGLEGALQDCVARQGRGISLNRASTT